MRLNSIRHTKIDDLAMMGGQPLFENLLHVGRPNIGDQNRLIQRIQGALDRQWLTNDGPLVREFEQSAGAVTGARHNIAVSNATAGLEIIYHVMGFKGEVIVPSFTFVGTVHVLEWLGITPVFCDISPTSHHIDPEKIIPLISPRTSGIVGVHLWGQPCEIDRMEAIARQHGLGLVFDAAHAFGCSFKGSMIGNFGDAEVFSFHATKYLNSFEGGIISTNNDELAEKITHVRNFGFTGYDRVDYLGINGKMNEISAAMGITSLENKQQIIDNNLRNYSHYQRLLSEIPGISLIQYDPGEHNNYHYIVLEIDQETTRLSRDQIYTIMHKENVLVRRYFYPGCHKLEPYISHYPDAGRDLGQTEKVSNRVLQLPTGSSVTPHEIDQICGLLKFIIQHGDEISACLEVESQ